MARQLPAGTDALTENLLRSDTQITCRYKAGTTDNAAKSIPFGLMQTSPIAVCSSGADSSSKVATVSNYPDFTLDNGKEVVVYFAEGNTAANPSMNVNGTGAIPLDSGYWNAGSFVKLKYVDITVSGTRIQKYLVDAGAYNTTTQLNGALTNTLKLKEITNQNMGANRTSAQDLIQENISALNDGDLITLNLYAGQRMMCILSKQDNTLFSIICWSYYEPLFFARYFNGTWY